MTPRLEEHPWARRRWAGRRWARALGLAAALVCLAGASGCAEVQQHNRDTLLRSRVERKPLSDWRFAGLGSLVKDQAGEVRSVSVTAEKDRACLIADVRTVDRTIVTERTLQNARRSRIAAYLMGGLGAANAVTAVALATQVENDTDKDVLIAQATIGAFLSISLITMIVREFGAIDSETHVGEVDLRSERRDRCDRQAAVGARVRLLRTKRAAVSEGVVAPGGKVTLPVEPAALQGDAIYALEVDGVVVGYIEIPGSGAPVPDANGEAVRPVPAQK
jgi:hypothetical protein